MKKQHDGCDTKQKNESKETKEDEDRERETERKLLRFPDERR